MLFNQYLYSISNNLKVFRDDQFPLYGGGNKGRKMSYIAKDILQKKANALVTNGSIQSNHCRAVALFAAQNKISCTLILHGSENDFYKQSGNAKIIRNSGVDIKFVKSGEGIDLASKEVIEEYKILGYRPYEIWGGGHTLEGGKAYVDSVLELKKICTKAQWFPDYIFIASGTGSTQAGILAGLDKYLLKRIKVVGISVARDKRRAESVVSEFYQQLCSYYNINDYNQDAVVDDSYLFGGYNQANEELRKFSNNSIKNYGLILDTCYTGKAFYGMLDYIKQSNLGSKNILFWHTGGIFNYLSQ